MITQASSIDNPWRVSTASTAAKFSPGRNRPLITDTVGAATTVHPAQPPRTSRPTTPVTRISAKVMREPHIRLIRTGLADLTQLDPEQLQPVHDPDQRGLVDHRPPENRLNPLHSQMGFTELGKGLGWNLAGHPNLVFHSRHTNTSLPSADCRVDLALRDRTVTATMTVTVTTRDAVPVKHRPHPRRIIRSE
jgi:hypothetical protein